MQERGAQLGSETVDPHWLNSAGHMRASGHVLLFEAAVHRFFAMLGLAAGATGGLAGCHDDSPGSTAVAPAPFLAEMHVCYRNEVVAGDRLDLSLRVLGVEPRRLHVLMLMHIQPDLELAASCELDIVCMDLVGRMNMAWPPTVGERLTDLRDAHARLTMPPQAGRSIRPCTAR